MSTELENLPNDQSKILAEFTVVFSQSLERFKNTGSVDSSQITSDVMSAISRIRRDLGRPVYFEEIEQTLRDSKFPICLVAVPVEKHPLNLQNSNVYSVESDRYGDLFHLPYSLAVYIGPQDQALTKIQEQLGTQSFEENLENLKKCGSELIPVEGSQFSMSTHGSMGHN